MQRTDHGGKFTSVEFMEYCADHGVARHLTAPILATAEQHHGASEPDYRWHGVQHDEGEAHVSGVLGVGSEHDGVHSQPCVDEELEGHDGV